MLDGNYHEKLQDLKVTSFEKYETSAVDYKMIVLIEFIFVDKTPLDTKVHIINELQEFFAKI